ncbi:MAG TPA: hypothetical protein PLW99_02215 [Candidatus Paceibacterota bacterium]|nr:hypothetical protein [Candidatus Paceibacterota bacterium]
MTFEDVEKNIEGSILKGLYLEAFLLQSAYIEGLLKNFAEFETWRAISYRRELEGNVEKIVNSLRTDVTRFGFRKLIDFVHESGFLEDKDKSALHKYREIRNNIVHSLPILPKFFAISFLCGR